MDRSEVEKLVQTTMCELCEDYNCEIPNEEKITSEYFLRIGLDSMMFCDLMGTLENKLNITFGGSQCYEYEFDSIVDSIHKLVNLEK